MVTIKIPGLKDIKLSAIEFNLLVAALNTQIKWESGGMFGDGDSVTDKVGYTRAIRIIKKCHY